MFILPLARYPASLSLYTIDDLVEVVTTDLAERTRVCLGGQAIIDEVLAARWRVGDSRLVITG